jgi:hypothetical protein
MNPGVNNFFRPRAIHPNLLRPRLHQQPQQPNLPALPLPLTVQMPPLQMLPLQMPPLQMPLPQAPQPQPRPVHVGPPHAPPGALMPVGAGAPAAPAAALLPGIANLQSVGRGRYAARRLDGLVSPYNLGIIDQLPAYLAVRITNADVLQRITTALKKFCVANGNVALDAFLRNSPGRMNHDYRHVDRTVAACCRDPIFSTNDRANLNPGLAYIVDMLGLPRT